MTLLLVPHKCVPKYNRTDQMKFAILIKVFWVILIRDSQISHFALHCIDVKKNSGEVKAKYAPSVSFSRGYREITIILDTELKERKTSYL